MHTLWNDVKGGTRARDTERRFSADCSVCSFAFFSIKLVAGRWPKGRGRTQQRLEKGRGHMRDAIVCAGHGHYSANVDMIMQMLVLSQRIMRMTEFNVAERVAS